MMMLLAAINYGILLPVAVFGAVFAVLWFVMDLTGPKSDIAEYRLDVLSDSKARKGQKSKGAGSNALVRAMENAAPALAKPLSPQTEKEAGKLKQRLVEAGFRSEASFTMFLSIKLMVAAALLFITDASLSLWKG